MRAHRVFWSVPLLALAACETPLRCDAVAGSDICTAAAALGFDSGIRLADASASGSGAVGQTGMIPRSARVNFALRTSVTPGVSPRLDGSPSTSGNASFVADPGTATLVTGELGGRVFDGVKEGERRAGGIDVITQVGLLVMQDGGGLSMKSSTPIVFGLGARVGMVDETRLRPALSFTLAGRAVQPFSITASPRSVGGNPADAIYVEDASVSVIGGRLAASKHFGPLGISAGGGMDNYNVSARYAATGYTAGRLSESRQRGIAFLSTSYTVGRASVGAEVGRLWGGSGFDRSSALAGPSPTRARTLVSLGVRFTPRFEGRP